LQLYQTGDSLRKATILAAYGIDLVDNQPLLYL
ncbi:MAG: hypothetical protein JWO53_1061, partial [Chlamydiia bacterium]|nr:hypothetical protein [Chlamydiia bacterium]